MAVRRFEVNGQLRLAPAASGRQAGVLVFDVPPQEVPIGAKVAAWLHAPAELVEVGITDSHWVPGPTGAWTFNPVPGAHPSGVQGYKFELAPQAPGYTVGGVTYRGRNRLFVASGTGPMPVTQREPVWADFAPAQAGSLLRGGKSVHYFTMPDLMAPLPTLPPTERRLLRVRFAEPSNVVVGAVLSAIVGGTTRISGSVWAGGHSHLVPGSILMTLPTSGGVLRDNGASRLVGANGDGIVDYLTGAYEVAFAVAEGPGNVVVSYEHSCNYFPIDVNIEWEAMLG